MYGKKNQGSGSFWRIRINYPDQSESKIYQIDHLFHTNLLTICLFIQIILGTRIRIILKSHILIQINFIRIGFHTGFPGIRSKFSVLNLAANIYELKKR